MTTSIQPKRVLIFDSGVGGLSILESVRQKLPNCGYIYACDNEAFPYGTKDEQALIQRVDRVLKALVRDVLPDIIVIACNTASTVALPRIRANFSIPVVGVVPAIKPAAQLTRSQVIGLLGTPGTVSRQYTTQLINDFANHCEVIRVGSSKLVEIAEAKLRGNAPDPSELTDILAPLFKNPQLDCIVLACTHFPLLEKELNSAAPRSIQWVNSGEAIARRAQSLLDITSGNGLTNQRFQAIFTSAHDNLKALNKSLESMGCERFEVISV